MITEVATINDLLENSVAQMKRLHTLVSQKKNEEQQAKRDGNYRKLVHAATQLSAAVHYAQVTFGFPYQPQALLLDVLGYLQSTALKETVSEESNSQASKKIKLIQTQTSKEWANFYPKLVSSTTSTLQIIRRIDPVRINKCLVDLGKASTWQNDDLDLQRLKVLSCALSESNTLIKQLQLDQNVTQFLAKVSSNEATLDDLTEEIMKWIHQEGLSERISISFK